LFAVFKLSFTLKKQTDMQNPLRNLPSVNELLERPQLQQLVTTINHNVVVSGVRSFLEDLREDVKSATSEVKVPTPSELAEKIADWIVRTEQPLLRPAVNATGVLLHTGLGRAPLPEAALAAMVETGAGYATLEVNPETGDRSHRIQAVEKLLCELTGAEAAVVVNNNAAATLLTLTAIAHGREVIVSRGELIEIGGSFRLPEVMTSAGAILREVGSTNKTRVSDYRDAISGSGSTAAMMRVHSSNYVVVGFTESPSLAELVALGRKRHIPVIDDIGSGALIDFSKYGVADEPIAKDSIDQGADLVLFSGDKLLGGPQCGIIVGKKRWIDQLANHPMMRALRVDKLTLAALRATLELYRDVDRRAQTVPLLAMLDTPLDNLKHRAEHLAPQLAACSHVESAEVIEEQSCLGGGSVPTQQIRTWAIAVTPKKMSLEQLAGALRMGEPGIWGRVQQNRLQLDLRTVQPEQDALIAKAFEMLGKPAGSGFPFSFDDLDAPTPENAPADDSNSPLAEDELAEADSSEGDEPKEA